MKKFFLLFLLSFSLTFVSAQIEGTWIVAPQAGALAVGPALDNLTWWANTEGDITTRACLFDDKYVFGSDGTFTNVSDGETWVETWQGIDADGCAAPVAPHDNSNAATWSSDGSSITLTGVGAYLGLAKAANGMELSASMDAPASVTYMVEMSGDGNMMTVDISVGTGFWRFILAREGTVTTPSIDLSGTWRITPAAGSLGVGPTAGDFSWWSNSEADVVTRACLFDDRFVLGSDGTFTNEQDGETWVEAWQGVAEDGCAVPVAPHDASNGATWLYDETSSTITVTGVGAHFGLAKVINGAELESPGDAPGSITYPVVLSDDNNTMTIDIETGGSYWHFVLTKNDVVDPPVEVDLTGTWRISPEVSALGVGPTAGDFSWWSNNEADITTRACLFDDRFIFSDDGTFANEQDGETWVEAWQGATEEGCAAPVAPHDGSNAATWSFDEAASTVTITGIGAHLGLAKVVNGAELDASATVPGSVTYPVVFSDGGDKMTIDIDFGGGFWHFVLVKEGTVDPPVEVDFEGTWILAPEAGALGVGPGLGDVSYWANSEADVTTRDCLFDDKFIFDEDGTFSNVQDNDTWLEPWQGVTAEGCGNSVAPHDGSAAATWSYDETAGTVTIAGVGAHLGLPKVINGAELDGTIAVPASITYPVVFSDGGDRMTIDMDAGGGIFWHFVLVRDETSPVVEVVEDLFSFYPNPATSEIRINSIQQMDELIIRDITGRILMTRTNPAINETMNISELPIGLYLLEARSDNQVSTQKFIVK